MTSMYKVCKAECPHLFFIEVQLKIFPVEVFTKILCAKFIWQINFAHKILVKTSTGTSFNWTWHTSTLPDALFHNRASLYTIPVMLLTYLPTFYNILHV